MLFVPFTAENLIYILLVVGGMMSGYLDDASEKPWGEYKKGLIDLVIALAGSFTYVNFNGSTIRIPFTELSVTLPRWLYILLGVVLIWTAINVTNCSDGVDGPERDAVNDHNRFLLPPLPGRFPRTFPSSAGL